jgi:phage shock protein PspC (stress-responsive transcriptional regulator)
MNKVITIRLGHYVLTIDEDAAAMVGRYTETLHRRYAGDDSAAEIVSDIEERIGELLDRKQKENNRNFTNLQDVNEVIEQMGPLEGNANESAFHGEAQRRLFRDPDNKILAGVWGGIGAYFDVDPVILRVIWALSVFVFGFGIPLYIILWVVMPEARTTAEKLMMRGQKPTLQNIEDNIKSEFNDVKKRFRYSQSQDRFTSFVGTLVQYVGKAIVFIGRAIASFVAAVLLMVLIGILIGVFTNSVYFHDYNVVLNGQEGLNVLLGAGGNPLYIKVALVSLVLLLIAVTGLNIFTTRKNRERTRMPKRYLAWGSTVALLILFVFVFDAVRSISHRTERTVYNEEIAVTGDTLLLDASIINTEVHGLYTLNTFNDILPSDDGKFRIEQRNIGYGHNRISSSVRLENSPKLYQIDGNKLTLNQGTRLHSLEQSGIGWVRYTLYVPKGKSVKTGAHFHFPENNYTSLSARNSVVTMDTAGNLLSSGINGVQIPLDDHISHLKLSGKLDVQIIQSPSNRIELVSGPILSHRNWVDAEGSYVEIEQTNTMIHEKPSFIRIYLKDMAKLEAESMAKVHFREWETQYMQIECSGASMVEGIMRTDNLELEIDGGGKVSFKGRSDGLHLNASGAGEYNCPDFLVNRANVRCSGASNITIWAKDEIEADASGGSSITLKGHPKESNVETSGASSFKKI